MKRTSFLPARHSTSYISVFNTVSRYVRWVWLFCGCGFVQFIMASDTVETDSALPINFQDILRAKENISGMVHNTPVMTCSYLDSTAGFQLFFKCENLQRTGSFKVRRKPSVFVVSDTSLSR